MLASHNMRYEHIGRVSKCCIGRSSPKVIQGHKRANVQKWGQNAKSSPVS